MSKKLDKEDIFHFKYSSTISNDKVATIIKEESNVTAKEWKNFLELFCLVIGGGLLLSGIIFFFAYNWNELSRILKFTTIGVLLCISVFFAIYPKVRTIYKQIALLSSSLLVGVLYAVFGQEYQTGANAYDFFLAWLMSIFLWTLISKFAFQWLFFGILANLTLFLYLEQVVDLDNILLFFLLLFALNSTLLAVPNCVNRFVKSITVPEWYNSLFLIAVTSIVSIVSIRIILFDIYDMEVNLILVISSIVISLVWLGLLYRYSIKQSNFVSLSSFALGVFAIVFVVLIRIFLDSIFGFLLYSLYFIGGSFALVAYLLKTLKTWNHGSKE